MRGPHPSPEILAAFVAGELDDVRAVAVAEHLDSCTPCRQLCLAGDPLHALLQASEHGMETPPDLAAAILENAGSTTSSPVPQQAPVIAMALLAAAALLFMMLGDPVGLMVDGTAWGRGLSIAAGAFNGPSALGTWIAAPGLALVSGALLVVISQRSRAR